MKCVPLQYNLSKILNQTNSTNHTKKNSINKTRGQLLTKIKISVPVPPVSLSTCTQSSCPGVSTPHFMFKLTSA